MSFRTKFQKIFLSAMIGGAFMLGGNAAAKGTLSLVWSGGAAGEAEREVYVSAFEEETGMKVDQKASELALLAQLESMVKVGDVHWDVAELAGGKMVIAKRKELLEPLDYSLIDPEGLLPDIAKDDYGVVWGVYSTVLVQNLSKNPEGKKMESWADFWDVDTFPGPRSLRAWPQENLEYALLADGVDKNDIYDILSTDEGVERALNKLDEIKPHIPFWWENGAQSVQALSDGEVYYSTTFNGRVDNLIEEGVPVEIVWNGGAMHLGYMGIPKGSDNIEAAHEYIRMRTMDPELGREYLEYIPYPGYAPGLLDGISEEMSESLPTSPENSDLQFVSDTEFWNDNIDRIQELWNEWMLQ